MAKIKVKLPTAEVKFCLIKGKGVKTKQDDGTEIERYKVSLTVSEDSEVLKHFVTVATTLWEEVKTEDSNAVGTFKRKSPEKGKDWKTASIRRETVEVDDKTDIDEDTGKVRRVETGKFIISAYTNVYWDIEKTQAKNIVVLAKVSGASDAVQDITEQYKKANWSIGEGSKVILSGTLSGNTRGALTFYLDGLQIVKLEKYKGTVVTVTEVDDDEAIDLDLDTEEYTEEA